MDEGADSQQAATISRFTEACQSDARVVAAFVGGSHAAGTADAYSDLDLYVIAEDRAYDDFFSGRQLFVRHFGNPLLLEDFDGFGFNMLVFILDNGVNGEVALARESSFEHIHGGPFEVLVDKKGILAKKAFPLYEPTEPEQKEALRRLVYWFWRDLFMFSTAMARGRLWSAYGQLESLRLKCVNLARLRYDFARPTEGYEKVEQAVDPQDLSALKIAFCSVERDAMFEAVRGLIAFYLQIAPPLAERHRIIYPVDLQRVVTGRLERSCGVLEQSRE